MPFNVGKEVTALRKMTMRELRGRYAECFGEETRANNKSWLVKRIAWRLQANAEGDLTERARQRAAELADDADLRRSPPKAKEIPPPEQRTRIMPLSVGLEHRLPPPGTIITRLYKGELLQVRVLADGFEFDGERYKSLSAVAKAVTGQHLNGYAFFKLPKEVAS
jgi:hypothetical protein